MDALIVSSKARCHVLSISFPSRTHPLTAIVEEQLNRLKASESACQKLAGPEELYGRVDDLLQLPLNQQSLSHGRRGECADKLLDESLRLLDICSSTRDVLSQMKECVQGARVVPRRRSGESSLENEIGQYLISRKKLNKVINKSFGNLKKNGKELHFSFCGERFPDAGCCWNAKRS